MPTITLKGNIFTTQCQTLVNTVNCVGVMGAGIALECRLRYPEMYDRYAAICENGQLDIGKLWLFKATDRLVLNFPTKKDWKFPSKPAYLHAGLKKFRETYEARGIQSIAFPVLGASKGGLPEDASLDIMHTHLDDLPLSIEIYRYDPSAEDDLYMETRDWLVSQDIGELVSITGIKKNYLQLVVDAMKQNQVCQLNQLIQLPGIGLKTLEKVFRAAQSAQSPNRSVDELKQQLSLI